VCPQHLPLLLQPHTCTKAFVDLGGNRCPPPPPPPPHPLHLTSSELLSFYVCFARRSAAVLLRMLPLIRHALQPPVIVCKNEELYAAAAMLLAGRSSSTAVDVGQWWASMCCSAVPLAMPLIPQHVGAQQLEKDGGDESEEQGGRQQREALQHTPIPFQSRRMHAERRIAAQRKAFEAQTAALIQACSHRSRNEQQQPPAAAVLASLDERRAVLLQQFNSLSCEHRAASKAGAVHRFLPSSRLS
jgi:hypothetical protein